MLQCQVQNANAQMPTATLNLQCWSDPRYLTWLKKHLANGEPVVWMIMCKGDSHDVYGIANCT